MPAKSLIDGNWLRLAPVNKINFIRCYAKARQEGMTKNNIKSGFRVTGNWVVSRQKAMRHPKIQTLINPPNPPFKYPRLEQ